MKPTSIGVKDDGGIWMPFAHPLHNLLSIWQAEGSKLAGAEMMRPGVEQLYNLSARLYLVAHIVCYAGGQMAEQGMKHCRALHHHGFGLGAMPAAEHATLAMTVRL